MNYSRRHSDPDLCQGDDLYGSRRTPTTTTVTTSTHYMADRSRESRRTSGACSPQPYPQAHPQVHHPSHRSAFLTNRYGIDFDQQAQASRPDHQQPKHQHQSKATLDHIVFSGSGGPSYRPRAMNKSGFLECDQPKNYRRQRRSDPDSGQGDDLFGSHHTATTATISTATTSANSMANRSWGSRPSPGALCSQQPFPNVHHPSHRLAYLTNQVGTDFLPQARPSRPDHQQPKHHHQPKAMSYNNISSSVRGPSNVESDSDRRISSNVSLSGSSVCSRSAPARRTPIPRQPAVYRPNTSCHSSNSLRTFEHRKSYTHDLQRRQSATIDGQQVLPPDHMDRNVGQHRQPQPSRFPPSERWVTNLTEGARNTPADTAVIVQIAPGVQAPLRGTKETYQAISKDFYSNVTCFGCSLEMCCIADAAYIVCPECKVISPLEGCVFEGKEIRRRGLGLGFTYESLFQMQLEIIQGRKNRN
jgi:hypothetical protein